MTLFFEVIVSYDIEDNRNRKKLFEELKDMGLSPIQKSVFWGHLKLAEIKILPNLFCKYCSDGDKAFFVKARLSSEIVKNGFGYTSKIFEIKEYDII